MNLSGWFPAWLMAGLCYVLCVLSWMRARYDDKRGAYWALIPAVFWLGTVYVLIELDLFGLGNPHMRPIAIRPALMAVFVVHIIHAIIALRQARGAK